MQIQVYMDENGRKSESLKICSPVVSHADGYSIYRLRERQRANRNLNLIISEPLRLLRFRYAPLMYTFCIIHIPTATRIVMLFSKISTRESQFLKVDFFSGRWFASLRMIKYQKRTFFAWPTAYMDNCTLVIICCVSFACIAWCRLVWSSNGLVQILPDGSGLLIVVLQSLEVKISVKSVLVILFVSKKYLVLRSK